MTLATLAATAVPPAAAQTCTEAQIVAAQEEGSAALRRLNAQTTPQIDGKLRELQKAKGWSDHDFDDKAYEQFEDETIRAFDRETTSLITRMETLSEPGGTLPPCERLLELRQTLERMREIAQQKSRHLIAKLDVELGNAAGAASPAASPAAKTATAADPKAAAKPLQKPEPQKTESQKVETKPVGAAPGWSTTARVDPSTGASGGAIARQPAAPPATPPSPGRTAMVEPPAAVPAPIPAPAPAPAWQPPPPMAEPGSYSREEIFAAGGGFFGKISSGLAGVLDFAFQKAGRPSGYILGDEGGGAFLAGVRYGEGLLHLKGQPPQKVYWRGPSFGYDIGAAGSRLMVLVYNVRDPEEVFASFGGVDGSAYFVGGVGVTFLTNGKRAMAPIRSGLGLRFGANIGYLKFSHKPSWNPF